MVDLEEAHLVVVFDGEKFPLAHSPHKHFYECLTTKKDPTSTQYFLRTANIYSITERETVLLRQQILHREFQRSDFTNVPVVSIQSNDCFVIEDGAHRLALMASRGCKSFKVGLTYWAKIPRHDANGSLDLS